MGRLLVIALLLMISGGLIAQDAQFRGPGRSGIFPDTALLEEWPEDGPEILFVVDDLGKAWSSAVVAGEKIFVTGLKDSTEYLFALNLEGELLWKVPYGRAWNKSFPEPRCTPTVDGDRLYVLTGMDVLSCLSTVDGKEIWKVDIHERHLKQSSC